MQFAAATRLALSLLLLSAYPVVGMRSAANTGALSVSKNGDRTITQVVKLLQDMLDKSKADGDNERYLYGKYKCYCDDTEATKKEEIATLTKEIGLLESDIEGLLSSSSVLSKQVADLKADMDANVQARNEATTVRNKENTEFLALEADLVDAIDRMKQAIDVLSEIGADQTLGNAAADHEQYMANYTNSASLVKLRATVKQALLAASSVIKEKQTASIQAFLQAPFTGTYTPQSGEVVGILKDLRETFSRNLETARTTEAAAAAAYTKYMDTMTKAHADMQQSYNSKQGLLSTNDSTLTAKRTELSTAEGQKTDAETFLGQLQTMCADKAKEYQDRTMLRASEETAIAEAISILNSDAAFEAFGKVTATKSGPTSFLQTRSIHAHSQRQLRDAVRQQVQTLLRKAANSCSSSHLGKITALLVTGNPFEIVLAEIAKLIVLLGEEQAADDQQLAWCNSERSTNEAAKIVKEGEITTLNTQIQGLKDTIGLPVTGLLDLIKADEDALQINDQSQKTETADRTEENKLYQTNIENIVEAKALLTKAIAVLKAYYSKILGSSGSFLAVAQPSPPPTWTGDYQGQSQHGGSDAITMLDFILTNTEKEEVAAHDAEKSAQHLYEDSMSTLKTEQAGLEASLTNLKKSLAQKQEELLVKKKDHAATVDEHAAIVAYLEDIKPGCDFITNNYDLRTANRVTEEAALNNAKSLIEGTPVYQTALESAHNESLGDCLAICAGREDHVECKACLAHVTIPGYCAGHPGTTGC